MDLIRQAAQTIRRYAMLPPGARVGVAVSGGADSICLLRLLLELDYRVSVLHVNHRLRGRESDADQEFVFELARRLRLPMAVCSARVSGAPGNVEQAARRERLRFFRRAIEQGHVDRVAVGHTRSDQAETVLFRFLRGAGSAGLAGVRPVTTWGMVRPLIEVERSAVEQFLRSRGARWREDSSNATRQFARNRIRHELLPQLAREWNPAIIRTLSGTAEWARAEEEYWEAQLDVPARKCLTESDGAVLLDLRRFAGLPQAVQRRLIRLAIDRVKGNLRGVDFGHVVQIEELAAKDAGTGRILAGGVLTERSLNWVRFTAGCETLRIAAPVPLLVPGCKRGITLELIEKPETLDASASVYNKGTGCLDYRRLSGRLWLRNWKAGDRYQPVGSAGEIKLKSLFQKAAIPVWERRDWPVLTDGDTVVWVRRFGPAAQFAADAGSELILLVRDAVG